VINSALSGRDDKKQQRRDSAIVQAARLTKKTGLPRRSQMSSKLYSCSFHVFIQGSKLFSYLYCSNDEEEAFKKALKQVCN
jgi:hypothetical protein